MADQQKVLEDRVISSLLDQIAALEKENAELAGSRSAVVSLLDYGAGNVRSVRNAIRKVGFEVVDISSAEDILAARVLVFPGVGAFGSAMRVLKEKGFIEPLKQYIASGRPFLGVCLGLQLLFKGSEESPGVEGLCVIDGIVEKFPVSSLSVPQIGWNGLNVRKPSQFLPASAAEDKFYFVHSFRATQTEANKEWVLTTTDYGSEYISAVQKGSVMACQFHPEKSGPAGLEIFSKFLREAMSSSGVPPPDTSSVALAPAPNPTKLTKRVIACLDVRENDRGDLVVTKGDQYDVREEAPTSASDGSEKQKGGGAFSNQGRVRNLGKPVQLSARYSVRTIG
jgi:glutamine amidotransferase/cyclase